MADQHTVYVVIIVSDTDEAVAFVRRIPPFCHAATREHATTGPTLPLHEREVDCAVVGEREQLGAMGAVIGREE